MRPLSRVASPGYARNMEKVSLKNLSKPVQSFLSRIRKGKGVLVEDAKGRARYGVILYDEAPVAIRKIGILPQTKQRRKLRRIRSALKERPPVLEVAA